LHAGQLFCTQGIPVPVPVPVMGTCGFVTIYSNLQLKNILMIILNIQKGGGGMKGDGCRWSHRLLSSFAPSPVIVCTISHRCLHCLPSLFALSPVVIRTVSHCSHRLLSLFTPSLCHCCVVVGLSLGSQVVVGSLSHHLPTTCLHVSSFAFIRAHSCLPPTCTCHCRVVVTSSCCRRVVMSLSCHCHIVMLSSCHHVIVRSSLGHHLPSFVPTLIHLTCRFGVGRGVSLEQYM
jgi:hypothetical protein